MSRAVVVPAAWWLSQVKQSVVKDWRVVSTQSSPTADCATRKLVIGGCSSWQSKFIAAETQPKKMLHETTTGQRMLAECLVAGVALAFAYRFYI